MPTKTTAGIIADLVVEVGGSVRSEKFASLALISLQKAIDHAPTYNFRESTWQDLVGIPPINDWDSRRFAITGRDVIPYPPAKQHQPQVGGYEAIGTYRPNYAMMEAGVGVDGAASALVTTLNFDLPIAMAVGPSVQRLVTTGPLTSGNYTLTQNGHTTTSLAHNASIATIQAALDVATIPFTASGGPLTSDWNVGFTATAPGAAGTFSVTPSGIVGGTLSIENVQTGTTPATAAKKVRFWYYRRALLPTDETAIIPLDDVYLNVAPLMFMHEKLSGLQLAGDQSNHAYQAQQLDKRLTALKRNRTNIRIKNDTWRSYDGAMGNVADGTRSRRLV